MGRKFKDRLNNYHAPKTSTVGHVEQKSDMNQGGAGSRHLDTYGSKHTAGALRGSSWANASQIHVDGTFHHTNGLFPNVHGHVVPFTKQINQTGGVRQPATASSPADVARAPIQDFRPLYKISGGGSGRTFWLERQKVRSGVARKVSKD